MTQRQYFQSSVDQDCFVLQIVKPVGSLADTQVMEELDQVVADLNNSGCRKVIVDFCGTAYFGSSLLEALRVVWNQVHAQGGHMVLCRLSPVGREILEVAKFDQLWPITADCNAAKTALQTIG